MHWYSILSVYWMIILGTCGALALLSEPLGWHILLIFSVVGFILPAIPGVLIGRSHQLQPENSLAKLHYIAYLLSKCIFGALFLYSLGIIGVYAFAVIFQNYS